MARGSIRKRGRDTWQLRLRVGTDPVTGKPVRVERTFRGSYREAQAELARMLLDQGLQPATRMTLFEWLTMWLEEGVQRWSPTTYDRYRRLCMRYFTPLANVPLRDLRPLHIQNQLNGHLADGVSPTTVNNAYRALRSALKRAVELGMLPSNPCDGVKPPRARTRSDVALTPEQIAAIVRAAQASQWWLPILVAASTGMRRGEVLGLRWRDLDLNDGVAHVRQTIVQVDGRPVPREPKSARSRRMVVLDDTLVQLLRDHRRRQAERRLQAGPEWQDHDLVFCTGTGQPLEPVRLSKAFTRYARQAGIAGVRFHDLRHSHISALLAEGWPITAVAERAGHATPSVTAQIYAHVMPGLQHQLMRRTPARSIPPLQPPS